MITVRFEKGAYAFLVTGHAGAGPEGHDLVCAAASTLAQTLAEYVQRMKDAGLMLTSDLTITKGRLSLNAIPKDGMAQMMIRVSFDTIISGFELLAAKYPNNITLIK